MEIIGLQSAILKSGDNLLKALENSLQCRNKNLQEGDVLAFSSKIVALTEKRMLKLTEIEGEPKENKKSLDLAATEKKSLAVLIEKEADHIIPGEYYLTVKNNIFVANAGIDESNVPAGYVIPWPKYPYDSADNLRKALCEAYNISNLGVIIADSVCLPLRAGTIGIAIGYSGFKGVIDKRGRADLFGKKLKVTQVNVADSLATAANLVMGEADEAIPFVLLRECDLEFTNELISRREISIAPEKCLFKGLYPNNIILGQ